ncbi:hypothetical protein MAP00_001888 [Monascus purpureus]|nr:hypothetical protein MAP00_001888 [Monascus purpureus]
MLSLRLIGTLLCAVVPQVVQSISPKPLSASGRWIVDSDGNNVTYAGVNWPGAADTMLPEGLQYTSIEDIVSKIKDLEMNSICLTFAMEMVGDIFENGADVLIKSSLINALGEKNGSPVFQQIIHHNPQFGINTTRLQVFNAVAHECYRQGIYVHLDNHVSKAKWCRSTTDGNSWFGDEYFDVDKWHRGWRYMA